MGTFTKIGVVLALVCAVSVNAELSHERAKSASGAYIWEGIAQDSTAQATWAGDTTNDTLAAAGATAKWFDMGPCPSDPADSGSFGVAVGGTGGGVGCSLFVSTHPTKGGANPQYLLHIPSTLSNNTGTIISDSLTSKSCGIYQVPSLRGTIGYRMWAKFYTYSGASAIALKRVFMIRRKK